MCVTGKQKEFLIAHFREASLCVSVGDADDHVSVAGPRGATSPCAITQMDRCAGVQTPGTCPNPGGLEEKSQDGPANAPWLQASLPVHLLMTKSVAHPEEGEGERESP